MGKLQNQQFWILKPIKYKNPDHPLYRKRVEPKDKLSLKFPHLPDEDIMLLQKTGTIAPITAKELKEVRDVEAAREKADKAAVKHEADVLAAAKAQALEKHLNKEENYG